MRACTLVMVCRILRSVVKILSAPSKLGAKAFDPDLADERAPWETAFQGDPLLGQGLRAHLEDPTRDAEGQADVALETDPVLQPTAAALPDPAAAATPPSALLEVGSAVGGRRGRRVGDIGDMILDQTQNFIAPLALNPLVGHNYLKWRARNGRGIFDEGGWDDLDEKTCEDFRASEAVRFPGHRLTFYDIQFNVNWPVGPTPADWRSHHPPPALRRAHRADGVSLGAHEAHESHTRHTIHT